MTLIAQPLAPAPFPAATGAIKRAAWMALGILLLSVIECRITNLMHLDSLSMMAQSTYRITLGEPHWKEYQNRLLGPFLLRALQGIFPLSTLQVYLTLVLGLHLVKNLLAFALILRLTGAPGLAARYTVFFILGFIFLQDQQWIYLWDYLDIVVFTVFLYGVVKQKRDVFFVGLFAPAMLNKESGLFIAVWLVLDSLLEWPEGAGAVLALRWRSGKRLRWGLALTALGVAWVYATRHWLLVKEIALAANPNFAAQRPFHLAANLWSVFLNLTHPSLHELNLLNPGIPLAFLAAIYALRKKPSDLALKLSLLVAIIFASLLLYSLLNEIRIYNVLLPFALFGALYYFDHLPGAKVGSKP